MYRHRHPTAIHTAIHTATATNTNTNNHHQQHPPTLLHAAPFYELRRLLLSSPLVLELH
jgi:hypothetical protein